MLCAYVIEGVKAAACRNDPRLASIIDAGPWQYVDHEGGTMVQPRDEQGRPHNKQLWDWEKKRPARGPDGIIEGMFYVPPVELPDQAELAKANGNSLDSDLIISKGRIITIECALVAPEYVGFGGSSPGEYATEYGRVAWAFYEKCNANDGNYELNDPLALEVVYQAVASRYRVTRDLLTDLRWISSDDIAPILEVAFGADPKSLGAESAT